MLVHVTRFIDVQGRVYEQIESERQDIVNRLRNEVAHESLISELRSLGGRTRIIPCHHFFNFPKRG